MPLIETLGYLLGFENVCVVCVDSRREPHVSVSSYPPPSPQSGKIVYTKTFCHFVWRMLSASLYIFGSCWTFYSKNVLQILNFLLNISSPIIVHFLIVRQRFWEPCQTKNWMLSLGCGWIVRPLICVEPSQTGVVYYSLCQTLLTVRSVHYTLASQFASQDLTSSPDFSKSQHTSTASLVISAFIVKRSTIVSYYI